MWWSTTSTTTDRDVAMRYAGSGKVGMVFEIQMGMVDRGAELKWLSQYPGEAEICFAPLTVTHCQLPQDPPLPQDSEEHLIVAFAYHSRCHRASKCRRRAWRDR